MKMTRLGANGPAVSQFGIGAMSFSGTYGDASIEQSHAVLDLCREAGVTHIDTANLYGKGRSEEIIGQWLADRPGAADEIVLATKAGNTGDPERRFNNDPDYLETCIDDSLRRLGVDCVDLFYIHRYDPTHRIEDVAGTLRRLVDKGKAKAVGLSEIAPSTLRRAHSECPIAAVQSEYSLATRAPELGLVQSCAELGATLVAFSPVGRSFLTDAPFTPEQVATYTFTKSNPRFTEPNYSTNIAITDRFRALAADMGEPAAAVAIAWVISRGDHVLPIPGTKNVDHLRELLRGTELQLSQDDVARIDAILPVGWAHGDRYSYAQWAGPERYC
ncbi:General stress protein 69 [Roseivivax jejudonensis]|uniref:General stress protein 69 n=1 Tax=Roseivivax jejudonensis TaxID=1529041 RepID=A0A1X6YVA0_9RHOB|nr:aldo/keto reductase [Roseivivax jejudonensis]SLN32189.1 General stress protein 69 [Roseivivax jejudonensis]